VRNHGAVYQSQMPVIEKAIETAALKLGSDRSRGYVLEMICADFLAGAKHELLRHDSLALLRQRVYQIVAGYEDANDADDLLRLVPWHRAQGRRHESLTLAICLATKRCMNLGPSFL